MPSLIKDCLEVKPRTDNYLVKKTVCNEAEVGTLHFANFTLHFALRLENLLPQNNIGLRKFLDSKFTPASKLVAVYF